MARYEELAPVCDEHGGMLGDGTKFPAWEMTVAAHLAQQYGVPVEQLETWEARSSLGDLFRPDNFNGSFFNIQITPLDDPHTALVTATAGPARRRFAAGSEVLGEKQALLLDPALIRGYHVVAAASSTKQEHVDDVVADVWYVFTPTSQLGTDAPDIIRYVSTLKFDHTKFDRLLARSVTVGRNVLAGAILNPSQGGTMAGKKTRHELRYDK